MAWRLVLTLEIGRTVRLSRNAIRTYDTRQAQELVIAPGLIECTVPEIGSDDQEVTATVATQFLDVQALKNAGTLLDGAIGEVSLVETGSTWDRRVILSHGRVSSTSIRRSVEATTFSIVPTREIDDPPFPPWSVDPRTHHYVSEGDIGKRIPVVYGLSTEVPGIIVTRISTDQTCLPFSPFAGPFRLPFQGVQIPGESNSSDNLTVEIPGQSGGIVIALDGQDNAVVKVIWAGHLLGSTAVIVRPDGGTANDARWAEEIYYERDEFSGAHLAYSLIPLSALMGASSIVGAINGHQRVGGNVMSQLGDVIYHALIHYGRFSEERIDHERLGAMLHRANRYTVACTFGGSTSGSLVSTLRSRFEEMFGLRIGWRNGKIGADCLLFDNREQRCGHLSLDGIVLLDRVGDLEICKALDSDDVPYSRFELAYNPNTVLVTADGTPGYRGVAKRDSGNSAECAMARAKTGGLEVAMPVISCPDVNTPFAASTVLDWLVQRHAVLRTRVRYRMRLDDALAMKPLQRWDITDADWSWSEEPFRLESIQPEEDTQTAVVTLISFNDSP